MTMFIAGFVVGLICFPVIEGILRGFVQYRLKQNPDKDLQERYDRTKL